MPRHPEAVIAPNALLSDARKCLASPHRRGQHMSRSELADGVNSALDRLYPGRDMTAQFVDFRWIGKLERGEHRWPSDERRAALRHVLKVTSDAQVGLYCPRRSSDATTQRSSPQAAQPPVLVTGIRADDDLSGSAVLVARWSGRETRALREASRMSLRAFAERLGVATATVSKWEDRQRPSQPTLAMQAVLDDALRLADPDTRTRFGMIMNLNLAEAVAWTATQGVERQAVTAGGSVN